MKPVPKLGLCAVLMLLSLSLAAPARCEVTRQQVDDAMAQAINYLRSTQNPNDGSWAYVHFRSTGPSAFAHKAGCTALVVYALSHAGVPEADPTMVKALNFLDAQDPDRNYELSFMVIAYAYVNPKRYRGRIAYLADKLIANQMSWGMWTYAEFDPASARRGDNSNTQIAVLALHEAMEAGAVDNRTPLVRARDHFRKDQNSDGGWGYVAQSRQSRGSMTCAAIASLYAAGMELFTPTSEVGVYKRDPVIGAGFNWLVRNYAVNENPRDPSPELAAYYKYYYLYSLERVGLLTGFRLMGTHDWFREGAEELVNYQETDGSWGIGPSDTAFGLLFLARGNIPVIMSRVMWDGPWNPNMHALQHLTRFIQKKFDRRLNWENLPLEIPVNELLKSPVLFISSIKAPVLNEVEKENLRTYVQYGGTIYAEATKESEDFDAGFRALMDELFPNRPMVKLPDDHPVYSSTFDYAGEKTLFGVDVACRTSIFYSQVDHTGDWEQDRVESSKDSFELGTNVAAYATAVKPVMTPLEPVRVPEQLKTPAAETQIPSPSKTFIIAQIVHDGDWLPDPGAMESLMDNLHDQLSLNVSPAVKPLRLTDDDLYDYPLLYMTGHYDFELSSGEKDRLKRYLLAGGFLFADSCCGRPAFDEAFRRLVEDLFGEGALVRIPVRDDIFSLCYKVETVKYSDAVLEESPGFAQPFLEGVKVGDRWGVVYSKYDIGCELAGHLTPGVKAVKGFDAYRLATNIACYPLLGF